ncbi:hypothetical protein COO59_13225 [Mixta theicola]|uniref:Uncharacterized protein n=1 Tax=Mixta theicola TaxID=1458355 RepID=A0A2K1Q8E0_9GAMM|nr:hypothetical protein [Mixta theicola]PNS11302.1 hypothetical protein COO59_13225 [Mixta theicola]GLR07506.1 hypothetical protein GCM10007905_02250 [Mixta theicola]
MSNDIKIIVLKFAGFFGCAIFLALMMGLVFIDVNWMNDALHETSFTEIFQEILLGAIALMFFSQAFRQKNLRYSLLLIGGFFACMLIREMDFLFDSIHHGAWVWLALAVAIICLWPAVLHLSATLSGLVNFLHHPSWNMMAAGLLTILIFSRLFGMHELWETLMLDGYNRTVKNMAEESTELLGYSFCLLASLRYLWDVCRLKQEKTGIAWQSQY